MGSKNQKTSRKNPEICYHIDAGDRAMNKLDVDPAFMNPLL